jgi:beta-lactamase regulating signal transducer with metallopeptidase domain
MVLRVGLGNAVAATVLAVLAASVGLFARGRPALRHGLWLLVLLKLVTPPLSTVPVAWVAETAERPAANVPAHMAPLARAGPIEVEGVLQPELELEDQLDTDAVAAADEPAPLPGPVSLLAALPWRPWLVAIWSCGSLATFAVAGVRIQRFRRILSLTEPAPESLQEQVEDLARQLGLARTPTAGVVPGTVSPLVWALACRPYLIVPRGLWDRLDKRQRATLLAHELAHLKRCDHWIRGLELVVTGLYWWLPVVWIARHALREAEEQCCDAWVVWAFPDAARTYAEALLETLDFLAGAGPAAAVAASGLGPVHHLRRRMTMIMQGTTPRALTGSGLLAVLGLSAIVLPLAPTWAEQRPTPEQEFFNTLKRDHELNDPRWPFVIKVKDVQDKTLIDATFKHRAGGARNPNSFDMVVQARKAEVDFQPDRGVASVRLDGVETTNPREDVSLLNNTILEIAVPSDAVATARVEVVDDEDEPAPSARRDGDARRDPEPRARRDTRVFRFERDGEGGELSSEAREKLEKTIAEIKELVAQKSRELSGPQMREQMERVVGQLDAAIARLRNEAERQRARAERGPEEKAERPAPRRPETAQRDDPEAAKEGREAAERREELSKLRAEVAERQKALMDAQRRLAEATRRQGRAGGPLPARPAPPAPPGPPGPMARGERFEFQFGRPGPGARDEQKTIRIVPRAEQDKRIRELEERLEKLQDEVKSLKKDAPAPK